MPNVSKQLLTYFQAKDISCGNVQTLSIAQKVILMYDNKRLTIFVRNVPGHLIWLMH